jgi:hypothetical protein
VALGALNSIAEVQAVAAGLAQRMPTKDQQPGDVKPLVELSFAIGAQHLTAYIPQAQRLNY